MSVLALRSRRVCLPDGVVPAVVVARGGRIVEVRRGEGARAPGDAGEVLDLGEDWLLPALTDCHVHVDEPGRTAWEGFASATRAAAAGGVTLLVDMPLNSDPVTTSRAALWAKLEAARGQLWVDVGFWGGVVPGNEGELAGMVDLGVRGFKCFLCPSGIDEFPQAREADLRRAMPVLRAKGVPLLVHAELEDELALAAAPADPAARRDYRTYLHARPKAWEDRAVALVCALARETGCRAHVVHLSSSTALETLRRAKAAGVPVTAETCPHYLGLAAEEVPPGATEFKCAPPIRERANQDALWAALADGTLDFVVTDHSPCVPALKRPETGDFLAAWGGVASLQLGLRSVWTAARRRGVPLERVVAWTSRGPARFLGCERRGLIAPGAEADLVWFRPEGEVPLDPATLLHRHPTTPWAGRPLAGTVRRTWLRGEVVHDGGRVDGPPRGRAWLGERDTGPVAGGIA